MNDSEARSRIRTQGTGEPAAGAPVVYEAFAKLNLGLWILGKRRDGYHEILTVYQSIDLSDELVFEDAPDGVIEVGSDRPDVPSGPANLAFQAAALLRDECDGRAGGVRVRIRKRIPSGAGLGGGSSDAAATLVALNERWALGFEAAVLERLGARIGSDVPFFVRGGTQAGRGRGEILEPLRALENAAFLLVLPDLQISTPWAFARAKIGLTRSGSAFSMVKLGIQDGDLRRLGAALGNDLEAAVAAEYPVIEEIHSFLESRGCAGVAMTGSGSGVFGVLGSLDQARAVRAEMSGKGWTAFLVRPSATGNRRLERAAGARGGPA